MNHIKKLLILCFVAIIAIVAAFLWFTRTPAGAWGCGDDCHPTPTPIVYHYSTCSHTEDGYFCQSHTSNTFHESTCDSNKDCQPKVTPTVTPSLTPTPTATPSGSCTTNCGNPPTFAGSSTGAPQCGDGNTVELPANLFVTRSKDYKSATVNFFLTQGDSANIYWKVDGQSNWQYSSAGTNPGGVKPNGDNFVSYTVNGLEPSTAYDFGVQQKYGCGSGQMVTAVVVDGPIAATFTYSFWEWSK